MFVSGMDLFHGSEPVFPTVTKNSVQSKTRTHDVPLTGPSVITACPVFSEGLPRAQHFLGELHRVVIDELAAVLAEPDTVIGVRSRFGRKVVSVPCPAG
jgi:hypothetical protein